MRRVGPFVSLALLSSIVGLGACSSPTELMLVIKAGPGLQIGNGAAQSIDSLEVQAGPRTGDFFFSKTIDLCNQPDQPNCRPQRFAAPDYMGALTLPIQLLLEPGSQGLDEEVHVWIDGYKSTGEHQLASGLHFTFSKGKRLWIELPLFGQCVGDLECEPTDTACVATGSDRNCVDIVPTAVEPDMATAHDGGFTSSDGSTTDGMSGGADGSVDQGTADLGVGDLGTIDLAGADFAGCGTGGGCCPGSTCMGGVCMSVNSQQTMPFPGEPTAYVEPPSGAQPASGTCTF